jgi:hypothetical protein
VHRNAKSSSAHAAIASQYENGSDFRSIRDERTQTQRRLKLIIKKTVKIKEAIAQTTAIPDASLGFVLVAYSICKKHHHTVPASTIMPKAIYLLCVIVVGILNLRTAGCITPTRCSSQINQGTSGNRIGGAAK